MVLTQNTKMTTEIDLLKAHIRLLHMATYAETMIRMMSYGLLKASEDEEFFKETVVHWAPHLDEQKLQEVTELIRESNIDSALKGAKGAALIFIHTGLEGCLDELAELDAKANPNDWMHLFSDKKLNVKYVLQRKRDELIATLADDYIKKYKRNSLLEKLDALFSVLKPISGEMSHYRYDREIIQRIDELRHDCAHGRIDLADFAIIYEDIEYLKQTGKYFLRLMANKHGVDLAT